MESLDIIACNSDRRFGVEIELNAFDGRDLNAVPLERGELPEGIHSVAATLAEIFKERVEVRKWWHTDNNDCWIVKVDISCGIEVCAPVSRGKYGLDRICRAVDALKLSPQVQADERCAAHVHVEVSDCDDERLASILAHWAKCEAVFLDSVPANRKNNRFCQCIGMCPEFQHNDPIEPDKLITKMGQHKYFTANVYQKTQRGNRKTVEFRIVGNEGCLDSYLLKNWVRLLLHFVEVTKDKPLPRPYAHGDRWSSLLWLEPRDVMGLLGFTGGCKLSGGMQQVRNWFYARIWTNLLSSNYGIWSSAARRVAKKQMDEIISDAGLSPEELMECLHPANRNEAVYGTEYGF